MQTLTTLNLSSIGIASTGAQHLANALKQNAVRFFLDQSITDRLLTLDIDAYLAVP